MNQDKTIYFHQSGLIFSRKNKSNSRSFDKSFKGKNNTVKRICSYFDIDFEQLIDEKSLILTSVKDNLI